MGADRLAYDLCAERGLNIRAVHKLKMVENFTLVFTVPAPYRNMILKKAPSRVESVIERIEAASAFQPKAKTCRRKVYEKTGLNGLK